MDDPLTHHLQGLEIFEIPGDKEGAAILCLHGYGANALDLAPLSREIKISPRPTWFFPNGPLEIPFSPSYSGRAWFDIDFTQLQRARGKSETLIEEAFPHSIDSIRRTLENLIEELPLGSKRLFAAGFSQGAVLALDVALHRKKSLAGVILLSGTLVFEKTWKALAPNHRGMPFFQSHGTHDLLLPIQSAVALEKLLIEAGLNGSLLSFRGGHEISSTVIAELSNFLIKH